MFLKFVGLVIIISMFHKLQLVFLKSCALPRNGLRVDHLNLSIWCQYTLIWFWGNCFDAGWTAERWWRKAYSDTRDARVRVGRCVGNPENLFRLANSGATFTSHGVHVEVWGWVWLWSWYSAQVELVNLARMQGKVNLYACFKQRLNWEKENLWYLVDFMPIEN